MIVVTGATGQLGRLVIAALLRRNVPANDIVAAVRSPEKAADLATQGVQVRRADYNDPASLETAFAGAQRVLLIASNAVGQRLPQHTAVIDAAQRAHVQLLAYTSILRADTCPMLLAQEHQATEAHLKTSGVPYVLLRNGWYTENYAMAIKTGLEHGVIQDTAGEGRIAAAPRADFAEAAAAVLTQAAPQGGTVYELAGDAAFTMSELAAEVARRSGKPVAYRHLTKEAYLGLLAQVGMPPAFAAILADSSSCAAGGALFDDSHQLSRLIGRPTTPWTETVAALLKA